jgi:hypothetical protein
MNKSEFKISNLEIAQWMNAIRNIDSHQERTRALDALWWGQLASKGWLVNHLSEYVMAGAPQNIYIFGGWIGILANMIIQSDINVRKIRSIDLDSWCEPIADQVNKIHEMDDWRFKAVTADMATYQYQSDIRPDIVINTSTEHVLQATYDTWLDNIPTGTLIVVQGNNYFECEEHIRCSTDISDFLVQNRVEAPYYTGEFVTAEYTRYMAIWRK